MAYYLKSNKLVTVFAANGGAGGLRMEAAIYVLRVRDGGEV